MEKETSDGETARNIIPRDRHTYPIMKPPSGSSTFVLTYLSAMNGVGVVHDWAHGSSAATAFMENAKSTTASAVQIIMDADMGLWVGSDFPDQRFVA
jgi:hypothetical protein